MRGVALPVSVAANAPWSREPVQGVRNEMQTQISVRLSVYGSGAANERSPGLGSKLFRSYLRSQRPLLWPLRLLRVVSLRLPILLTSCAFTSGRAAILQLPQQYLRRTELLHLQCFLGRLQLAHAKRT